MGCKIKGCTHLGALTSKGTRQFPLGYCNTHYRRFKKYGDPHMRKAVVGEGRKDDPIYQTYGRMLRRVDNPNSSDYKYYGLLGIKICQGWRGLHGFSNFKNDGRYKIPPLAIAEVAVAKCSGVIAMPWP